LNEDALRLRSVSMSDEAEGLPATLGGSAARGAVEAACLATFLVPFIATLSRDAESSELVAAWVGLTLGGAVFALGPAAWSRADSRIGKGLALFVSSIVAVASVAAPVLLAQLGAPHDFAPYLLAFSFAVGLGLGLGQTLAGVPFSMVTWRQAMSSRDSLARAAMLVTYSSLVFLVPFFVIFFGMLGAPAERLANMSMLVVYVFPILTLLRMALAPLAENGAKALLAKKPVASTHAQAVLAYKTAFKAASESSDDDVRMRFLETALENARIAYAFSLTEPTVTELSDDRRRYLELIFMLGRTDEIETALARFCESPALEAELARLRGDPAQAAEIARRVADAPETNATDRANAQSILALALAELGRFDEARERLEAIARAQKMVKPLVPRFSAGSVAATIDRLEAAAKPTGTPVRARS